MTPLDQEYVYSQYSYLSLHPGYWKVRWLIREDILNLNDGDIGVGNDLISCAQDLCSPHNQRTLA